MNLRGAIVKDNMAFKNMWSRFKMRKSFFYRTQCIRFASLFARHHHDEILILYNFFLLETILAKDVQISYRFLTIFMDG